MDDKALLVAIGPETTDWLSEVATSAGARLVPVSEARVLIWTHASAPQALAEVLHAHPDIEWVQLPWAGVEPYVRAGLVHDQRIWSAAKGIYSQPVAEHALALSLAGFRQLKHHIVRNRWGEQRGTSLFGATVTIFGSGGIAAELARQLGPFECQITCVARTERSISWAHRVVTLEDRQTALATADLVVLALALSPATQGIIGPRELQAMKSSAWLVNVARGAHVDTSALTYALHEGTIGGAALDVTDPEPLPKEHPLWVAPNCIITPHTAVTGDMSRPLLARHVAGNLKRYASGMLPLGIIDPDLGY